MNRERVPPWASLSLQWYPTLEELDLQSAPCRPRLWKQHVDATSLGKVGSYSIRPTIKFTTEMEEGESLPSRITRRMINLTLLYTVKRHTWTCTCTSGLTIRHVKRGTVRDHHHTEGTEPGGPRPHGDSYPRSFIRSASAAMEDNGEREERGHQLLTSLALVRGSGGWDFNIRAVFKSGPILCSLRSMTPIPTEKRANILYEVPCTSRKNSTTNLHHISH